MSDVDFVLSTFAIGGLAVFMYYSLYKEVSELEDEVLVMEDEVLELEKKIVGRSIGPPPIEDKEMQPQDVWEAPPLDKKKEGVLGKIERLELMKRDGDELSRSDVSFLKRIEGYIQELGLHRDLSSITDVELEEYLTAKEEEYKSVPRIKPAVVEEYDGQDEIRREIEQLQREKEERRRRGK